ncbi:MAG: Na/Pi cotransporter family protein [Bacilli bacterium]|nr:Na/Pi cotransporter family protein [Bacilli bacterium]
MSIIIILSTLSLLIYSINKMTYIIEASNQNKIKNVLNKFTKNIFLSFITGIVVCLITQSSSIITILIISLVSSKTLSIEKGLAIIIGANIGTTLISLIITLDIGSFYFLFILLGVIIFFLKKHFFAEILIYLGLIFLSLDILEKELISLFSSTFLNNLLMKATNPITGILSGTFFSFLIQSSSATIALTQKLYMNNLISASLGTSIMLGANIGTTISGLIFSLNCDTSAKRVSLASLLFNLFGVLLTLPFLYIYKDIINNFKSIYLISTLHIYFNIITGFIGLFFIKPLCNISCFLIKEK